MWAIDFCGWWVTAIPFTGILPKSVLILCLFCYSLVILIFWFFAYSYSLVLFILIRCVKIIRFVKTILKVSRSSVSAWRSAGTNYKYKVA